MNNRPHIFLDIDGVLATTPQYYSKKRHEEYNCYHFDVKCVKVFNEILARVEVLTHVEPVIILSSDWKMHFDINALNNIFKWNEVRLPVTDVTEDLWGVEYRSIDDLEKVRASEIKKYVKDHDLKKWVAIDDLDLSPYLVDDNFVNTPRHMEGIKQSGIKEKMFKRLL